MKKINAFTLMEVTVAMLLSAVVIGICYTAFTLVNQYYINLKNRKEAVSILLQTDQLFNRDFSRATNITLKNHIVTCELDSGQVTYDFQEKFILRGQYAIRIDTLKLEAMQLQFLFEKQQVEEGRIDELSFSTKLKNTVTPLHYKKAYSAVNLFE